MTQLSLRGFTLLAGVLALLCSAALSADSTGHAANMSADTSADRSIEAVWKEQRLAFRYNSSRSFYSCQALAKKIGSILLSIGAREDVRMSQFVCAESFGTARFEIEF